jgi:hypothetical protein
MKKLLQLPRTLILVLALSFSAGFARAESFTFSYLFGDDLLVTGSFNGDLNGNFAENINGLSVFFNGAAMPGSVFASRFDGASYLNGPVISFDALQNNFVFANSDLAGGDFGFDSVFYMLNASVASDTAVAFSALGYASQDEPTAKSRWKLAVPDHSATFILLGLALAGLAGMKRSVRRNESPAIG